MFAELHQPAQGSLRQSRIMEGQPVVWQWAHWGLRLDVTGSMLGR